MPSIRQPPPGLIHVHSTVKNLDKNICLPLPVNRSTPALVSTISSLSSSDLDKIKVRT